MSGNNAVTNTQEAYFKATTTTTVKIEAVEPIKGEPKATTEEETKATAEEEPKATAKEETKATAKEETKATAKEETKATAEEEPKAAPAANRNDLWLKILLGALLILGILAVGLWLGKQMGTLPGATSNNAPASGSSNTAPIVNNESWVAVLTSANSNGNFIGDMGGHGAGTIIPSEMTDLGGKSWPVGRVLLTYCETASSCFYKIAEPGYQLERAYNVNAYTPQFTGDLTNELRYIDVGWNNNANVVWTLVQ